MASAPTRERLLASAARLFAEKGYNEVGIIEVGAELGMSGAALYRHFKNKAALLVEMCDQVIIKITEDGISAGQQSLADADLLERLIQGQLTMVCDHRDVLIVYLRELSSLPPEDLRRMRRQQRLYLEEWMHAFTGLRPELGENARRTLVHASIGVLHSVAQYEPGLPAPQLRALLRTATYSALGLPTPPDPHAG